MHLSGQILMALSLIGFLGCNNRQTALTVAAIPELHMVPLSQISVSGTANRPDIPLTRTIDGNLNTFMSTVSLNLGDTKTIIYKFSKVIDLKEIRFYENYVESTIGDLNGPDGAMATYNLGDMIIRGSMNSSDGTDGTWFDLASLTHKTQTFFRGDGAVSFESAETRWVKLEMTYNGDGAFGGTPSFYLSEIEFYE